VAETLVIRIPSANKDMEADWVAVDAMGACTVAPAQGALADIGQLAPGRDITLLLPSSEVLRIYSDIPLRSSAKILQALPFALEEQLAQDVDSLHFAIGERNSNGLPVSIVSHEYLQETLGSLREAGIHPTAAYAESDAVTPVPSTHVIWLTEQQLIIRDPEGNSVVSDAEEIDTLMQLRFPLETDAGVGTGPVNVQVYCSEAMNAAHAETWDKLRLRIASLDIKLVTDGGIAKLASGIRTAPGINLLQGIYAVKRNMSGVWPIWRVAASLLAAAFALSLAVEGLSLFKLTQQERTLDAAAGSTLSMIAPNAGDGPDPWGQLQSRLQVSSGGAVSGPGFIEALNVLAGAVSQTKNLKIEALNFRNETIDLRLQAPAVDALDKLCQLVNEGGVFVAVIQSANPSDNAIKGRIQVKLAGS